MAVFLPGKSQGQRSLAVYSPWGHKESDKTEKLSTSTHQQVTKKKKNKSNVKGKAFRE